MVRGEFRRAPIRASFCARIQTRIGALVPVAVCGIMVAAVPAAGQDDPGDQKLSFGINQRFAANDNIRLDPTSVGTTFFSDTTLSFGFSNQTQAQSLNFELGGVGRLVKDPLIGTDSGFRDPTLALSYTRDSVNSRLSLFVDYSRPDLAFLDPLQQADIGDQDLFHGGGTRTEYLIGARVETGLQSPVGFEFGVDSSGRRYSDTTDPLLFENRTDTARAAMLLRFSGVTQGRLDLYDEHYEAKNSPETDRTTRSATFGLTHAFSAITTLSANIGHSEVIETFNTLPPGTRGETVTRGPIGSLAVTRLMPNGVVSASLDTSISSVGRQNTLEFGRTIELPDGSLAFSFGASDGDNINAQPIGSIDYRRNLPAGAISASVSRDVSISPTLSRAERTTRVDLGYQFNVNDISYLSFNMYYADISLTGSGGTGPGRERGSFYATYTRDITEYWDFEVGYEYRYFSSSANGPTDSNLVFFTLQRDFDMFR